METHAFGFKHSKSHVFATIDSYTQGRLRSILRKRRGGKDDEGPNNSEADRTCIH